MSGEDGRAVVAAMPGAGRQSLFASGALTAVAAAWTTVVGLVTVPLMVHGLGADDYGLYSVAFSIAALGSYLDLGLGWTTAKFVAEAEATGEANPGSMVAAVVAYHAVTGGVFAAALIVAAPWIVGAVLQAPPDRAETASFVLRLAAASFVASSVTGVLVAALRGLRRFTASTLIGTGSLSLSVIGAALLASGGFGVVAAAGAQLAGAALGTGAALVVCAPLLAAARGRGLWQQLRPMLGFSSWSYGTRLIQMVVMQFDKVIVARWLGPAAVTFYSVPFNFAQRVNMLAGPAITAVYPVAAAGRVDREVFMRQYLAAARLVHVTTAALAIAVLVWGDRFLAAWVGAEMAALGAATLQALTIGFWLVSVGSFDGSCVEGWNRPRANFAVSIAAALAGLAAATIAYLIAGSSPIVVATGVAGYFVTAGLGQMVRWYQMARYPLAFMVRRVGVTIVEMVAAGALLARLLDGLVTDRVATIATLFALVTLLAVYGLWRAMSTDELRALGLRIAGPLLPVPGRAGGNGRVA